MDRVASQEAKQCPISGQPCCGKLKERPDHAAQPRSHTEEVIEIIEAVVLASWPLRPPGADIRRHDGMVIGQSMQNRTD